MFYGAQSWEVNLSKVTKKSMATLFRLNVLPGISQSLWNLIFQSLSCASKNLQQQVENAVLFKCLTREFTSLLSQPKTSHGDTLAKCSPDHLAFRTGYTSLRMQASAGQGSFPAQRRDWDWYRNLRRELIFIEDLLSCRHHARDSDNINNYNKNTHWR